MSVLANKTALVTGGGSGIGLASVERFVREGATVVLADVDVAAAAHADRVGADFVELDVSDPDSWASAMETIDTRHGGLDIAFLNAGVMTRPANAEGLQRIDVTTLDDADYRRVMSVNVDGVVFGLRAVVPKLRAKGGGAIVVTASLAGLMPYQTDPIYAGTKHFVIGLVRAAGRLLIKENITLNAVCPAGVATNIIGPPEAHAAARAAGATLLDPSEIAAAVVHAIEDESTAGAWTCQAGRPPERFDFAKVPGIS